MFNGSHRQDVAPPFDRQPGHPDPTHPGATSSDSLYDELMKLDELRQKGILTDEEFCRAEEEGAGAFQLNPACA